MVVGRFFFSATPTAQNSPELHFRFINYFIQSSLLWPLITSEQGGNFHSLQEDLHAENCSEIVKRTCLFNKYLRVGGFLSLFSFFYIFTNLITQKFAISDQCVTIGQEAPRSALRNYKEKKRKPGIQRKQRLKGI